MLRLIDFQYLVNLKTSGDITEDDFNKCVENIQLAASKSNKPVILKEMKRCAGTYLRIYAYEVAVNRYLLFEEVPLKVYNNLV